MGSNRVEITSGPKIYKLISGVSNEREQPGTTAESTVSFLFGVPPSGGFGGAIGLTA
jgi:hypothetical protein